MKYLCLQREFCDISGLLVYTKNRVILTHFIDFLLFRLLHFIQFHFYQNQIIDAQKMQQGQVQYPKIR